MCIKILVLIHEIPYQIRPLPKVLTETETYGSSVLLSSKVRREIILKKSEGKIAVFGIAISEFTLNTRLGREFILQEGVHDLIFLVSVLSPPVGVKVVVTKAEGCPIVDAGEHSLSAKCAVFPSKKTPLKCDPVPVEQGIEFVEGEIRRALGAD